MEVLRLAFPHLTRSFHSVIGAKTNLCEIASKRSDTHFGLPAALKHSPRLLWKFWLVRVVGGAVEGFLDVRDRPRRLPVLVEHEPQEVQGVRVLRV